MNLNWAWKRADGVSLDTVKLTNDFSSGDWQPTKPGDDVFHGRRGFVWIRTELGSAPPNPNRKIHFESVDDNAAVFLNGARLAVHRGWDDPFDVSLASAWKAGGPNELEVLDENTDGPGGLGGPVWVFIEKPEPQGAPEAQPAYDDSGWRKVHLPHDYVIEGTYDRAADNSHASLPLTPAWYRREVAFPKSYRGRSIWVDFDGVFRDSTVYWNGHKLGTWQSGYIGFRYDLSRYANFGGRNVLAVRVDPRRGEGWWYEGGGIYRHVWLNVASPVHIKPWSTFVRSNVDLDGPSADVTVSASILNTTGTLEYGQVLFKLLAPNGHMIAQRLNTVQLWQPGENNCETRFHLDRVSLWSVEAPKLYTATVQLLRADRSRVDLDSDGTLFGIRKAEFDVNRGFLLNGKPVKIKGTCNHQDHAGVGIAIPDNLLYWRIQRLKEIGCNAYRCSHNPPAPALLDACDRLGMLVMDETRHLGDALGLKTPPGTDYSDLYEVKNMVLRDRNHPSVIMWSMCNEEPLQGKPEGAKIFSAMRDTVLKLDPTRPVTCAMSGGWGDGISRVEDLVGMNYSPQRYDEIHADFPNRPMYGSETASTMTTRGIYENEPANGYVSAYDIMQDAEDAWQPIAERPWMAGGFVWTGFDYKGEPSPYGWPAISSNYGIMDSCGFAKDNTYYYQAWWNDKPIVHIEPHWNWPGKEGQPIKVWVFSNGDSVELFLNGKSLGRKQMPPYRHLEWEVPYAPGKLIAKAYNSYGALSASDEVDTVGPAVALRFHTNPEWLNDTEDVTEIQLDVVDAQGRIVPTANNLIHFRVDRLALPKAFAFETSGSELGPNGRLASPKSWLEAAPGKPDAQIVGVGNGDPSDHSPDRTSQRLAFNGHCACFVGAPSGHGGILIRAEASGLQGASCTVFVMLRKHGPR